MAPSTIANRYRVDQAVGRGGMGTVWLCTDEMLGRAVAVKEVGHLPGQSTPDLSRALREARSAAALSHPNVVSIFDAVEDGGHIWLVMEYVPGRTLSEILRQEGSLAPERAAEIGAQVADGLAAAHLRGTTHRDVKPGNILVADGDHAKISDFGIARTMGDAQLTQTGMVTGTPGYFSPQLARGEDPSPADDVWALGATLFTAVEGHPPFPEQSNALAVLSTIANSDPPRPQRAGSLTEAILNMMQVDPASRWSMADAAYHLRRLPVERTITGTQDHPGALGFSAAPTLVTPSPIPEAEPETLAEPVPVPVLPATPSGRSRRWPLVLLGVTAAVVAAVVLWISVLDDDPDETSADVRDRPSGLASRNPGQGRAPTNEATPDVPEEASTPDPEEATPEEGVEAAPVSGDGPEKFVSDYYALLPDDTEAAWRLLSPEMQAKVGSYDDYAGFWATIDSVSVDDTVAAGPDAVDVALTYTADGVSQQEVRRLDVAEEGEGFVIVGDQVMPH